MKNEISRCSLIVALVTTAFFFVLLPLQTYLSNQDMFLYGVWEILPELLASFIVVSAVLSFLLYFIGKWLGRFPHLLVMGVCLCGYLQVTLLSIGMPQLNGELWLFQKWSVRQYLDVTVFSLVFIVLFVFRKTFYRYLVWIMVALLVMQVSFCADALVTRDKSVGRVKTEFDGGFCPVVDVVKSLRYSKYRNIIVLSLDSSPADLADEIVCEDASLRKRFYGFYGFSENIGMHDNTTRGIPSFATGQYIEKDTHVIDHAASFWGDDSAVTLFKKNGYDMFVRMGAGSSYTNVRKSYSDSERGIEPKLKIFNYTKSDPYITLFDIVKFKLARWRKKHSIMIKAMMDGNVKMAGGSMLRREYEMYPYLLEAPVGDSLNPCFIYLHTEGVHVPVLKDENGNDLQAPTWSKDGIKRNLHYLLRQVAEMMDAIQEKGIYDNTMIIISTDHGIVADPKSALLWIKPFNSKKPFKRSNAPTSLSKVSDVLKSSVDLNLSINEIEEILSEKVRRLRVRQVTPDKWWQFGRKVDTYDIFYDDKGAEMGRQNLGEFLVQ